MHVVIVVQLATEDMGIILYQDINFLAHVKLAEAGRILVLTSKAWVHVGVAGEIVFIITEGVNDTRCDGDGWGGQFT